MTEKEATVVLTGIAARATDDEIRKCFTRGWSCDIFFRSRAAVVIIVHGVMNGKQLVAYDFERRLWKLPQLSELDQKTQKDELRKYVRVAVHEPPAVAAA